MTRTRTALTDQRTPKARRKQSVPRHETRRDIVALREWRYCLQHSTCGHGDYCDHGRKTQHPSTGARQIEHFNKEKKIRRRRYVAAIRFVTELHHHYVCTAGPLDLEGRGWTPTSLSRSDASSSARCCCCCCWLPGASTWTASYDVATGQLSPAVVSVSAVHVVALFKTRLRLLQAHMRMTHTRTYVRTQSWRRYVSTRWQIIFLITFFIGEIWPDRTTRVARHSSTCIGVTQSLTLFGRTTTLVCCLTVFPRTQYPWNEVSKLPCSAVACSCWKMNTRVRSLKKKTGSWVRVYMQWKQLSKTTLPL